MTQKINLDAIAALAREARARADRATPGPWKWWTSCSFRRLTQERRGAKEGGVMYAFRCSDGVSDIQISEADMAFTEASRTDVPTLADAVLALVERVRELEAGPVMPETPSEVIERILVNEGWDRDCVRPNWDDIRAAIRGAANRISE